MFTIYVSFNFFFEFFDFREELTSAYSIVERKDEELAQIRLLKVMNVSKTGNSFFNYRQKLASVQREASLAYGRLEQQKDEKIASIRG